MKYIPKYEEMVVGMFVSALSLSYGDETNHSVLPCWPDPPAVTVVCKSVSGRNHPDAERDAARSLLTSMQKINKKINHQLSQLLKFYCSFSSLTRIFFTFLCTTKAIFFPKWKFLWKIPNPTPLIWILKWVSTQLWGKKKLWLHGRQTGLHQPCRTQSWLPSHTTVGSMAMAGRAAAPPRTAPEPPQLRRGAPGRFVLMRARCGAAAHSAYKITPFLLSCEARLLFIKRGNVLSCDTPSPQKPTCVDFTPNPLSLPPPPSSLLWILRLLSVTNSPTQGYCLFFISAFVFLLPGSIHCFISQCVVWEGAGGVGGVWGGSF